MRRELPVAAPDGLLVGVVVGAQGLKGEVKVKTFTQSPGSVGNYGPLFTEDGRKFAVKDVRTLKGDNVSLRLNGINDRSSAEAMKGVRLYIERSALPKPARNEFYHADLVGLRAENEEGAKVGVVRGVHNFGAGDMLEIAVSDTDTTFIPFTKVDVPVVDIAEGRIVVRLTEFWQDEKQ